MVELREPNTGAMPREVVPAEYSSPKGKQFWTLIRSYPLPVGALILLVLAWRVAGYYGVDRYLLPILGTPWTGSLAKAEQTEIPRTPTVAHA